MNVSGQGNQANAESDHQPLPSGAGHAAGTYPGDTTTATHVAQPSRQEKPFAGSGGGGEPEPGLLQCLGVPELISDAARVPHMPGIGHRTSNDPTAHEGETTHDPTSATDRAPSASGNKPSVMQKAQGTVEEVIGKVTHSPAKVESGHARKTGTGSV